MTSRGAGADSAPTLAELLAPWSPWPPPRDRAEAAVLIVLRQGDEEPEALLIERAERPGDRGSGQVAFPGGHVEPGDANLRATALRECDEEVGLSAAHLGEMPRYVSTRYASAFGLLVAIFAAPVAPFAPSPKPRDPREVASTFWIPRSALGNVRMETRRTLFGIHPMPSAVHDGHVVWGFTRRVLREFFGFPPEPLYDPRSPPLSLDPLPRHR
jgi:8-oxo-dGTP pyrophosphatase MutT (NUDIX family)